MAEERPIGVDDPRLDDAALEALAEAHATPPPDRLRARVLAEARRAAALRATAAVARWRLVGSIAAAVALVLGGLLARGGRLAVPGGAGGGRPAGRGGRLAPRLAG